MVAGAGGTGIIMVGALLGMAAHLEGKGVSVLDTTCVAQKGGAVTTVVRIAAHPQDLHTIRIAAGEADAVIGSDLLVTAENAILARMQKGVTRVVINTNRMATVTFIENPDLQTPWVAMEEGLRDVIGADAARFIDATRVVTGLLGDSLGTNIFLLGYACQMGLVPVCRAALVRAIELNGAAVAANQRAFDWGRLACHDPAGVAQQARPAKTASGSDRVLSPDLESVIARRAEFLTAYHFAPPLWAKPDKVTGVPTKRSYGAWMRPLLGLLTRCKGLRGTMLDPFGHIEERRLERELVADYERTVARLERDLRPGNLALAVKIASLPATIRGYGHVNRRSIDAARARETALLAQYRAPAAQAVALAT